MKQEFCGLTDDLVKALYLLYATTGLRKCEALNLSISLDVDLKLKCVKSKHDTRSKKAGFRIKCKR